jgi:hypothetical protein
MGSPPCPGDDGVNGKPVVPEAAGSRARGGTPAASQPSHREGLRGLDPALRPVPREATSCRVGTVMDDYAPCADSGQNCGNDIYALSLPGVIPSTLMTWFQAQAACKNARKRLPTNAEWQAAVAGTPDPGSDNGTTDCNTGNVGPVLNGARSGCVSEDGAFDMVGNRTEWVADWVAPRTTCGSWSVGVSDYQCLAGVGTTGEPSALTRGGDWGSGSFAGPLAISGDSPSSEGNGFRCAR